MHLFNSDISVFASIRIYNNDMISFLQNIKKILTLSFDVRNPEIDKSILVKARISQFPFRTTKVFTKQS